MMTSIPDSDIPEQCGRPESRSCLLTNLVGSADLEITADQCSVCRRTLLQLEAEFECLASQLRAAHKASLTDEHQSLEIFEKRLFQINWWTSELKTHVPENVGEYQVLGILGRGGMGVVYHVCHPGLQQEFALKMLLPSHSANAQAIARFEREMATIQKLKHPGIVPVIHCGQANGRLFIVMPVIDGVNVASLLLQNQRLSLADTSELIRQVAEALSFAHKQMIVHRDIKPSNIMLAKTAEGGVEAKLLDLGVARTIGPGADTTLTEVGQPLGTLDYMAPEQIADSHTVDQWADIYSLGVTSYRLFSGVTPFAQSEFHTPFKRLMAIKNLPAPSLANRCPDLPLSLTRFVDRMLEKEPLYRPRSMEEVASVFSEYTPGHCLEKYLVDTPSNLKTQVGHSCPNTTQKSDTCPGFMNNG